MNKIAAANHIKAKLLKPITSHGIPVCDRDVMRYVGYNYRDVYYTKLVD